MASFNPNNGGQVKRPRFSSSGSESSDDFDLSFEFEDFDDISEEENKPTFVFDPSVEVMVSILRNECATPIEEKISFVIPSCVQKIADGTNPTKLAEQTAFLCGVVDVDVGKLAAFSILVALSFQSVVDIDNDRLVNNIRALLQLVPRNSNVLPLCILTILTKPQTDKPLCLGRILYDIVERTDFSTIDLHDYFDGTPIIGNADGNLFQWILNQDHYFNMEDPFMLMSLTKIAEHMVRETKWHVPDGPLRKERGIDFEYFEAQIFMDPTDDNEADEALVEYSENIYLHGTSLEMVCCPIPPRWVARINRKPKLFLAYYIFMKTNGFETTEMQLAESQMPRYTEFFKDVQIEPDSIVTPTLLMSKLPTSLAFIQDASSLTVVAALVGLQHNNLSEAFVRDIVCIEDCREVLHLMKVHSDLFLMNIDEDVLAALSKKANSPSTLCEVRCSRRNLKDVVSEMHPRDKHKLLRERDTFKTMALINNRNAATRKSCLSTDLRFHVLGFL